MTWIDGATLVGTVLSVVSMVVSIRQARQAKSAAAHAEESPAVMTVPLMVLAGLSVFGGALNLPFEGFHNLGHWLGYTIGEVEGLPLDLGVAGISTVLALLAIFFSWLLYGKNPIKEGQADPLKKPLGFLFTGMENTWFVATSPWPMPSNST